MNAVNQFSRPTQDIGNICRHTQAQQLAISAVFYFAPGLAVKFPTGHQTVIRLFVANRDPAAIIAVGSTKKLGNRTGGQRRFRNLKVYVRMFPLLNMESYQINRLIAAPFMKTPIQHIRITDQYPVVALILVGKIGTHERLAWINFYIEYNR